MGDGVVKGKHGLKILTYKVVVVLKENIQAIVILYCN